jgi:hypothetical protein
LENGFGNISILFKEINPLTLSLQFEVGIVKEVKLLIKLGNPISVGL